MAGSKFFPQSPVVVIRVPSTPNEAYAAGYRDGFRDGQFVGPKVKAGGDRVAVICNDVCAQFGLTKAELTGNRRNYMHVHARRMAALRMSEELGMSLPMIGRILRKDHTTILRAIRRARGQETRRNKTPVAPVVLP